MDLERARKIIKSEETIDVYFNDAPVWIESINSEHNTVMIKPLNGPQAVIEIPVTELSEK